MCRSFISVQKVRMNVLSPALPDDLTEEESILLDAAVSLTSYSTMFCDLEGLTKYLINIAKDRHLANENFPIALETDLSQEDLSTSQSQPPCGKKGVPSKNE